MPEATSFWIKQIYIQSDPENDLIANIAESQQSPRPYIYIYSLMTNPRNDMKQHMEYDPGSGLFPDIAWSQK